MSTITRFVGDRPWLIVVAGIGLFTSLTITFVVIACLNPPTLIPR